MCEASCLICDNQPDRVFLVYEVEGLVDSVWLSREEAEQRCAVVGKHGHVEEEEIGYTDYCRRRDEQESENEAVRKLLDAEEFWAKQAIGIAPEPVRRRRCLPAEEHAEREFRAALLRENRRRKKEGLPPMYEGQIMTEEAL